MKAEHEGRAENGDNAKRTTQLAEPPAGGTAASAPVRLSRRRTIAPAPKPESDTSGAERPGESRKDAAEPPCKTTIAKYENKEQNGQNRSATDQRRGHPGRAMAGSVRIRPPRGWTGLSTGRDARQRRMTLSPYLVTDPSRAKPAGELCAIHEGAPCPDDAPRLRIRRWRRVRDDARLDIG